MSLAESVELEDNAKEFARLMGEVRNRMNGQRIVNYWNELNQDERDYIMESKYGYVLKARWFSRYLRELDGLDINKLRR